MSPDPIVNIADLRAAAESRRLPRAVFDYLDGTADDGITGRDNIGAFFGSGVRAAPGGDGDARPVRHRAGPQGGDAAAAVAGRVTCRLLNPGGDPAVARAAGKAGVPFIQATGSGYAMDAVAPAYTSAFLPALPDGRRAAAERALARAKSLGVKALFITVDTPVSGNRELDPRNGMAALMGTQLAGQAALCARRAAASALAGALPSGWRRAAHAQCGG